MVTLSDLVGDITQNACESGADTVELEVTEIANEFRFSVKDNGKGMSHDEAKQAVDPFEDRGNTKGKIGIGIPFLIKTVDEHAGGWNLHTEKGSGTTFTVWFDLGNAGTPPVGDIALMFRAVLLIPCPSEIIIRRLRRTGKDDVRYEIRKTEITEAVGGFADAASVTLLSTYLKSLEENRPAAL
ncbi:MAG: ATP-binding protein [Spirochaetaceae bacterium]|jgi:hypothetical protein|nr:ATP-binding protein [Spirochaetaceae bacterium]